MDSSPKHLNPCCPAPFEAALLHPAWFSPIDFPSSLAQGRGGQQAGTKGKGALCGLPGGRFTGGEGGHLSSRVGVHGVHAKVCWVHARWEEVEHTTYDHAGLSFDTLSCAGNDPFILCSHYSVTLPHCPAAADTMHFHITWPALHNVHHDCSHTGLTCVCTSPLPSPQRPCH